MSVASIGVVGTADLTLLSKDGERLLCRGWRQDPDGLRPILAVVSASAHPSLALVGRLAHEYALRDKLDSRWAARPVALAREQGRVALLLEDCGGKPLDQLLDRPLEIEAFLRVAIALTGALGEVHQRGLIHKDIKPANALVDLATAQAWLTGFGIASRLPRERLSPGPPELLAGTLAYMAPEQTGRMNRSIDSRSDLYSLGVTFYQMLTGALPFAASDPLEWVHCHIAQQPIHPAERSIGLPAALCNVVLKLLAKTAEERYQTAAGLKGDLRRCLSQWQSEQRIDDFPLGEHDAPDRLRIPEKLYGRSREIACLLAAFDRVLAGGAPELVLVSGYPGIGKSSVVHELHKAMVRPRALFASGKFDQFQRDIPYATVCQALQSLVHRLLGASDNELSDWRQRLQQALDPHGSLMVDLVPELQLIIGAQRPLPDLAARDSQARFQVVLRRFISVFARPEHPLILFLDDLQWIDSATLELIGDLLVSPEMRHLLVIGAYRDNEVSSSHPLARKVSAIRKAGATIREIVLSPLGEDDVAQMLADTIRCEPDRVRPLARLVQEKTGGNPLFAIQFFMALSEEGLLVFDGFTRLWHWNMVRVRAKSYTDNVVDLMVAKLKRLPSAAQDALKLFACLGSTARTAELAAMHGVSEGSMTDMLWEAVQAGLVSPEQDCHKFLHDRIQQAAYSLIPEDQRAALHVRIGRALAEKMTVEELEERSFDVANQFNRGTARLLDLGQREEVAAINLKAGRRAKASVAYASACVYLSAGMALIGADALDDPRQYELAFALHLERAECEMLSGNFDEAKRLIDQLIAKGTSKVDKAAAYSLRIVLHLIRSEKPQGVATALQCLRLLGIDMPAHPTRQEVETEYNAFWASLAQRPIEDLINLPLTTDPEIRAAMRVLVFLIGPALYTDINLYHLVYSKIVNLSLKHGICDACTFGFGGFGVILCEPFRRYPEAYRLAKIACDLVEKHEFSAYKAKVYLTMEMAALWTQPIEVGLQFIRAAFRAGAESGDLSYACFSCMHLITDLLVQGAPLAEVWQESVTCLDFVRRGKYHDAADAIISQQQFIRSLQGKTAGVATFTDASFDEASFEAGLTEDRMTPMISRYWILKTQAQFIFGDYKAGLSAAIRAGEVHWSSEGFLQSLDYHYYAALAIASYCSTASEEELNRWRGPLAAHNEQLRVWAENYPPTFADKHALVAAEIARLEGRDAEAMRLYEQAIRSARENGFLQNEAIAQEVAARFYAARGFETIAEGYLSNARYCYLRWGADGKAAQLDRLYPRMAAVDPYRATATIGSPLQQLDVATVVKASQAVSSEIVLPKLIERLMTIVLENAGADRGLLILPSERDYVVQAEAQARGNRIDVVPCRASISEAGCSESLLRYVIRTRESMIVDDTSKSTAFSDDAYLRARRTKSILCLPLVKQGLLTGLLYLENALTTYAFPSDRIAVVELLAAQAAISLENTRLYTEVQQREAQIRRLVDSNIVGIFIWQMEGQIIEANEAFLRMLGYGDAELGAGRLRWTDLTPPEWRDRDERYWIPQLKRTGSLQPFEKEYFRKDGSRVPVLIGITSFDDGDRGVAFVLDLTERKRAEAEARESEQRYREVQTELARANRLVTMGQLTASIAHEVNQPIAGAAASGHAALRWLERETPDLPAARRSIERVIRDSNRASDVIARIRELIRKAPPRRDRFDINEAIRDVIMLTRGETAKNAVSITTRLADALPLVEGDQVQLRQVILNLVINAIEAMSGAEGPRELLIESDRATGGILVAIRDSGPGFGAKDPETVFDAFYTTKPGGLGMGLAICRSLVQAHDGRLWVTANAPRGAAFQFTIPSRRPDP